MFGLDEDHHYTKLPQTDKYNFRLERQPSYLFEHRKVCHPSQKQMHLRPSIPYQRYLRHRHDMTFEFHENHPKLLLHYLWHLRFPL